MIYDCFTFFEEWEVLRIRLEELKDVVDRFIMVEAAHTFRGENRLNTTRASVGTAVPSDFASKITNVIVSEPLPASPWQAEAYVRNAIMRGLTRAQPDDLVLISDVDEIPRASIVADPPFEHSGEALSLVPRSLYYTLDWEVPLQSHFFPVLLPYGTITTPQSARLTGGRAIPDAGWHFSCLGAPERLARKLQSFAHSECDRPEFTNLDHIAECMRTGKDVLGRFDLTPVDVDETYPQYVQDHLDEFAHLLRPR